MVYISINMSFFPESMLSHGKFEPINHAPDSGKTPVCPAFELIKICNGFAGIEGFDCGQIVIRVEGNSAWKRGMAYLPKTSCTDTIDALERQIDIIERPVVDISKLLEKPAGELSNEEIEKITSVRGLEAAKNAILDRFKLSTFNVCRIHPSDKLENHHFKPIEKIEDITDEEALDTAKLFLNALKRQESVCEQMPKHNFDVTMD